MKATEFVKHHGIEYTKGIIIGCESGLLPKNNNYGDLKQIVEAFELVEKDFGSVEIAEYEHMVSGCYSDPYWIEVRKAINLVEQCQ